MISLPMAERLRAAGLRWQPRPGDRFVLPGRGMDEESFVLSDMTIEVHQFPTGPVIGFNGVAEWALDSVGAEEALWLPAEHQLRGMLGGLFAALRHVPEGFLVELALPAGPWSATAAEAADAYALALEHVLLDLSIDQHTGAGIALG
ncbi:MAG: pilus assembly protein CpaE [Kineosporiaceae bacterium]